MKIFINFGILILFVLHFIFLSQAAADQTADHDDYAGALTGLLKDESILQKATNGMIELQQRQKAFLAKIAHKTVEGAEELAEKQKAFLKWAVGPEQVSILLEIFTYFTRLDVPICIAKKTLEGMNTDQNQLLQKVEEKSKNQKCTRKDKYDIALADQVPAQNNSPKHDVTAQKQPNVLYDHRKSFSEDAKSKEDDNEPKAYKFGVGGVAKIFVSDGLNCEDTLAQPGFVVDLLLKIAEAIKKQHDKMEFSDRIKHTIGHLKKDPSMLRPKEGSIKQKLRDELDQAEKRLAQLDKHLEQKLAELGQKLTSKELGTEILSGVKNMAIWFIKPIHIVDMIQFMIYFTNLFQPFAIAEVVLAILGLDIWLAQAAEKFYIKMYCRGEHVAPAKWLFGPNGLVPLFLRKGIIANSAETLKTVQGKTTTNTQTQNGNTKGTQTQNASTTGTQTQNGNTTGTTQNANTTATDTQTQDGTPQQEEGEVYIDCEGIDRTKHVKEWDLRQQIAFLKHIGDEIIHHKGHPFHEMVGRIVENLHEMKADMKDKWQKMEQTWDKIETKVKGLTVKEVGHDLKEFAAWIITPARLNQVIKLILVLNTATFPVYLTLQVMEALGITDLLLKQMDKLDKAAAKEFVKLACYRALKKAQKASESAELSENAVAQKPEDCEKVDREAYTNLFSIKAVDFMVGKKGLVPLFLTLGDINHDLYERRSRIKDEATLVKILLNAATTNNMSAIVPDMITYLESKFISRNYILVIFQKWNHLNVNMYAKFKQSWDTLKNQLHLAHAPKAITNKGGWDEQAWETAEQGKAMDSNDIDEHHLMGAIGSEEDKSPETGCVGCYNWVANSLGTPARATPAGAKDNNNNNNDDDQLMEAIGSDEDKSPKASCVGCYTWVSKNIGSPSRAIANMSSPARAKNNINEDQLMEAIGSDEDKSPETSCVNCSIWKPWGSKRSKSQKPNAKSNARSSSKANIANSPLKNGANSPSRQPTKKQKATAA